MAVDWREADRETAALLKDFLPPRIFDAHAHSLVRELAPGAVSDFSGREKSTYEGYCEDMRPFYPGVESIRLNIMPFPDRILYGRPDLRASANAHIVRQLNEHPECVGSVYVMAGDSEDDIRAMLVHPGIHSLKCYCFSSDNTNWEENRIDDYLPESAWTVANELGLVIVLHMMRPKALSDPDNFATILEKTEKYPNARLLLAHCARGFAAWTVIEGLKRLPKRENIWFDVSAICEPAAMMACIQHTNGKRVVWGSDYPIIPRARAVSIGSGFGSANQGGPYGECCFQTLESLLALKQACELLGLSRGEIEDLFWNNAMTLFSLDREV